MAHYDEQEEALLEKERKIWEQKDDDVLDFEVPDVDIQLPEDLDIPEVDIKYQEDDGNSNCDGGGCTI